MAKGADRLAKVAGKLDKLIKEVDRGITEADNDASWKADQIKRLKGEQEELELAVVRGRVMKRNLLKLTGLDNVKG